MAYTKQTFVHGQTLTANHLNHIEDGVEQLDTTVTNVVNQVSSVEKKVSAVERSAEVIIDEVDTFKSVFAPAIRGSVVGSTVVLPDISKVERSLAATVSNISDPTSVTVTCYGQNVLQPRAHYSEHGYTVTKNEDGSVSVTGAADTTEPIYLFLASAMDDRPLFLADKRLFTLREWSDNGVTVGVKSATPDGSVKWCKTQDWNALTDESLFIYQVFILSEGHSVGDTSLCGTYRVQLTAGDCDEFIPYTDSVEYSPDGGGNVSAINIASPYVILMSSNKDAVISVTYNRDTETIFNSLLNRIVALENRS